MTPRNDEGRLPPARATSVNDQPLAIVTGSVVRVRLRLAMAALVQAREAIADGDLYFAEASLENAETELAVVMQAAA